MHRAFRPVRRLLPRWLADSVRGVAGAVLVPILSSYHTGHFRSSLRRMAVTRAGEALPWYTYPCIDFLKHRPYGDRVVLEFGGGQSTLWWARRASHVVTLEGDHAWYRRIARRMPPNVALHHVEQATPDLCVRDVEEALRQCPHPSYDVVVIDGLWRTQMIDIAVRHVAEDGMIICDDAHGYGFQEGFRARGFNRVDFFGYAPGGLRPTVTAVYFNPHSFGFSDRHAIPAARS